MLTCDGIMASSEPVPDWPTTAVRNRIGESKETPALLGYVKATALVSCVRA